MERVTPTKGQTTTLHARVSFATARRIRMLAMERGTTIGELLDELVSHEPSSFSQRGPHIYGPVRLNGKDVSCVDVLLANEGEAALLPYLNLSVTPQFLEIANELGYLDQGTRRYHIPLDRLSVLLDRMQHAGIEVTLSRSVERIIKGEQRDIHSR